MLAFQQKVAFFALCGRCFAWLVVVLPLALVACERQPSARKSAEVDTPDREPEPALPVAPPESSQQAHHYRVSFDERGRHLLAVEAFFPVEGEEVELMMPTWTPGSYLIREYARHVQDLNVVTPDGKALDVRKTSKNRWLVKTAGVATIVVRYKVFSREMSVRTNFIDKDLAVLNGASTFLTLPDHFSRPHVVELALPDGWRGCVSGMPQVRPDGDNEPSGGAGDRALGERFIAKDFDQLVDSPLLCGTPTVHRFWALSKEYVFANSDESDGWNGEKSVRDLKRVVEEHVSFWGQTPYDRYVFLNVNEGGGGGLEHSNSTLMLSERFVTDDRESYLAWLGLVSHEFFHTWNVKRLRPEALGPFDYEQENFTPDLWIAEGFTSYYGDLLLARAGIMKDDEYLAELSKIIERVQTTPGRRVQSLRDASFDAWIKYYRPDDNAINSAISYYSKGALVAFLLDAKIREASGKKKSLDDVMRAAYEAFSGESGFSSKAFRALAEKVSGAELDEFFERYVDGTAELDFGPALSFYGLRFKQSQPEPQPGRDAGADGGDEDRTRVWLGIAMDDRGRVTSVRSDAPAAALVNVDDEVLALDGFRVSAGNLEKRLERYRPGQVVTLLLARRGKVVEITVKLDRSPTETWELEPHPKASMASKHNRFLWLVDARREESK